MAEEAFFIFFFAIFDFQFCRPEAHGGSEVPGKRAEDNSGGLENLFLFGSYLQLRTKNLELDEEFFFLRFARRVITAPAL